MLTEENYPDLVVKGQIPPELNGRMLARVGPNPAYKPVDMKYYHWFDGDGMMNAFRFSDGKVSYTNRFVGTFKHETEKKFGRALFGGLRSTAKTKLCGWHQLHFGWFNLLYLGLRRLFGYGPTQAQYELIDPTLNCANTNIVAHADRLLALDEAGKPYQVDPVSLSTFGLFDFDGQLESACVAHPLEDPVTGDFYTIGYGPFPPYAHYYVFDKAGKRLHYTTLDLAYPAMMHSFCLTRQYVIFFHLPAVFDRNYLGTQEPIRWEPQRGARIGIMPRFAQGTAVKWFDLPKPVWLFHTLNAYEAGDRIVIFPATFPRLPLMDLGTVNPSPPFTEEPASRLVRWELDLPTGAFSETEINPHNAEFPSMDGRFLTQPQRHGYSSALLNDVQRFGLWNTVCHYDFTTGGEDFYTLPPEQYVGEPVFTPKTPQSPEGEGYLLAIAWDRQTDHSRLLIFDAMAVQAGPIAEALVPRRIEYDFHGNVVLL